MFTEHPIKLKDGREIPAGAALSWERGRACLTWLKDGEVFHEDGVDSLRAVEATGVEVPSLEQLHAWVFDSVCDSVLGAQVEPDGFDPEGSPSWLLVFGLV